VHVFGAGLVAQDWREEATAWLLEVRALGTKAESRRGIGMVRLYHLPRFGELSDLTDCGREALFSRGCRPLLVAKSSGVTISYLSTNIFLSDLPLYR